MFYDCLLWGSLCNQNYQINSKVDYTEIIGEIKSISELSVLSKFG